MSCTPAGTSESGGRRMRISYMAQSPEQCTSWLHSMYRGGEGGVLLRCPGLLGQCEWHKWGDNSGHYAVQEGPARSG